MNRLTERNVGKLPAKRNSLNEARAIAILKRELERGETASGVELGIGDDAAILKRPKAAIVSSIDSSVEGVHFDLNWLTLGQAAGRALVAAASDLSAMGALPLSATVNLEVPPNATAGAIREIGLGQYKAAQATRCPVVGGNIVRGTRWVFTTHVLGEAKRPRTRSGARAGEEVWLCGAPGLASLGLTLLQRTLSANELPRPLQAGTRRCLNAWRSPTVRVEQGLELQRRASSLIDVSDGLSSELQHLARASQVSLQVNAEAVLALWPKDVLALCLWLGLDPLEIALQGGEDYLLLATGASRRRPAFAYCIGQVAAEPATGVRVLLPGGQTRALSRAGFDHLGH